MRRLNLNIFGLQHVYGLLPAGASPVRIPALVREAERLGFHGVEIPSSVLTAATPEELRQARDYASSQGLEITTAVEGTDTAFLDRALGLTEALGSHLMRTVVGGAKFGGDRRPLAGKWKAFIVAARDALRPVVKRAEKLKVTVSIENHQDAASEDLLYLCKEIGSDNFGVTLDTANALAVAENPLDFLSAIVPHVKYAHLKDYVIHWTDEGYLLVRCPVGTGVVPMAETLAMLDRHGKAPSVSVELAALEARHVRCFQDDFWPDYEPRSAHQFARVLAFVRKVARPAGEDHRTPFERGEKPAAIATWELGQYQESIRQMSRLTGDKGPLKALTEPAWSPS
ncbi:MAG TPA: sugar phosphate isomerase/epimerase [Gemmatimonadales bacterium]|jgi:sugar phosphate isomerase/epimerase